MAIPMVSSSARTQLLAALVTLLLAAPSLVASTVAAPAAPSAQPSRAGDPEVRPGEWSKRKVPRGWVVIETRHYHVQSQVGEEKGQRIGEHLEAMLEVYREMLPFRKRLPTFVVKIFRDREGFLEYYPSGTGAAAYYDQTRKELVGFDSGILAGVRDIPARVRLGPALEGLFDAEQQQRLDALFEEITDAYTYDLADVFSHEGWHQYFHYYTVSWVSMPSWLDEGMGDYFFTARRDESGTFVVGELNHTRLRRLQRAFDEGSTVPFGRMLEFEQRDYYANPGVFYAQGWSMVHFLMQHEDEDYRELIPDLLRDFKDSKNFVQSTERVLGHLDLDELDEQWILWVITREPDDPLRTLADEFGDLLPAEGLQAPGSWVDAYAWRLARREEAR